MKRQRAVFTLSLATLILTYALIVLGGVVHATDSSLACPDWPLCEGRLFPEMKGGVLFEHGHRLLAALVGLCAIALALMLWLPPAPFPRLRAAGLALPLLVIFQGVLGGITVIYKLPTIVSTAHLATSMIVLVLLVALNRASWVSLRTSEPPPLSTAIAESRAACSLLLIVTAAVYAQIVLGALVRHTGSSWSAGFGPEYSILGKDMNTGDYAFWPTHPQSQLNMLHRYMALIVTAMVVTGAGRCRGLLKALPSVRTGWLWVPPCLALAQLAIGVGMIAMFAVPSPVLPVLMRALHLAVATALLGCLAFLCASMWTHCRPSAGRAAASGPEV